ncbi:MAG: PepSY domain-containing protein [Gammaproteobacteria bacterium]|nr:PepSY domain-containing protein [Gammaproteobacteria bacterium]
MHKQVGIWLLVWVVWMVASGLMMNHAPALGLAEINVRPALLTVGQRQPPPERETTYQLGGTLITQLDRSLYRDDQILDQCEEALVGAVALPDFGVVACGGRLLLLSNAGEIVEVTSASDLGLGSITAVAVDEGGRLLIRSPRGAQRADADLLSFTPVTGLADWVQPVELPEVLRAKLLAQQGGISWARWLSDLHSGRLFGRYGPLVVDGLALLLLLVSVTGYLLHRRRVSFIHRDHR